MSAATDFPTRWHNTGQTEYGFHKEGLALKERNTASASWTYRLGVAALYLFALSTWLSKAGGNLALALMLLAFFLDFRAAASMVRRNPVFILSAVFAIYLLARVAWAAWEFPATVADQVSGAQEWIFLWLFPFVAWWIGTNKNHITWIFFLAVAGLFVGIVLRLDWSQLGAIIEGARSGFGRPIPVMALFSATALVGLFMAAPRVWGAMTNRLWFVLRGILWIVLVGALLEIVIVSQSRITWLAVLLVLPPLLWVRLRGGGYRPQFFSGRLTLLLGILSVLAIGSVLYANMATLSARFAQEKETIEKIVTFELENVPYDSVGTRAHLNNFGFGMWLERPLFGWGPGTRVTQFADTPVSDWTHLHNTYLEVLVKFGLFGAVLFVAGLWAVGRSLWNAYRAAWLPQDYFLIVVGAFALLAIWSLANFRMTNDWRFHCILFGAVAYAFSLTRSMSQASPSACKEKP